MVSIFIPLIYGCSRIEWHRVYNNCQPCDKDGLYVGQCDSGSFNLGLGWTRSLRMVGPPYIPLFPIPIGDSKEIYVFVYPKYDSLNHVNDAPEFGLRPKGKNFLVRPTDIDTSGIIPRKSYRYFFDIKSYSPDTLEVVFTKKYLGCELPTVTFIATKKTIYEPLVFPAH